MTIPAWYSDEFGTLNLYPDAPCPRLHVWVQPRPVDCDCGHWEWGYAGQGLAYPAPPPPSYFFMRLETAIEEVEAWLAGFLALPDPPSLPNAPRPFRQPDGHARGWGWTCPGPGELVASAGDVELRLRVLRDPRPHLLLSDHAIARMGCTDGFPRRYLLLDHALREAEEFLAWHLLKVPAQVPMSLDLPARDIGALLAGALRQAAPAPIRPMALPIH